jgi:hypothetical protein
LYFAEEMLRTRGQSFDGKTVAVSDLATSRSSRSRRSTRSAGEW